MELSENNQPQDQSSASTPSPTNRRRRHSTRKFERSDFIETDDNVQTAANSRRNSDTNLYFEIFTKLPNSPQKQHQKHSPKSHELSRQAILKYKQNQPTPLSLFHENSCHDENAPMSCPSNIPKMSYFANTQKLSEPITPMSYIRRRALKASKHIYIDEFDDQPRIKNFGQKSSDDQNCENAHESIKSWELSPRKHEMHKVRKFDFC